MSAKASEDPDADPPVDPESRDDVESAPSPFDIAVPAAKEPIWDIVAVTAAGGACGGAARHLLNVLIPERPGGFPWSTFTENVLGSFLLGMLMVFLLDVWPPNRYLRPFLGVGVLGGFTTFSAYTNETRDLLMLGEFLRPALYLFGSVGIGLFAVSTGVTAGRALARERSWRGT